MILNICLSCPNSANKIYNNSVNVPKSIACQVKKKVLNVFELYKGKHLNFSKMCLPVDWFEARRLISVTISFDTWLQN